MVFRSSANLYRLNPKMFSHTVQKLASMIHALLSIGLLDFKFMNL